MNVMQIASQANPAEVLRHYLEAYEQLHGLTEESVVRWRTEITQAVGLQTAMYVEIVRRRGTFDVNGVGPGGENDPEVPADTRWSLSLTPWGQWKLMPVVDATGLDLKTDQLAAHLLYEMTWYGWPEKTEQLADDLRDTMEQLERALAEGKSPEELGGFTVFDPKDFGLEDD